MIILSTLIPLDGLSQTEYEQNVQIRNTEVIKMKSKHVKGMEYYIQVALPWDYNSSDTKYPVIYYTDAIFLGGTVIETYRWLRAFNHIPPMVLIGISYNIDVTDEEAIAYRARDFTPTKLTVDELPDWLKPYTPESGGAKDFLSFIENELFPEIESNYRIDSSNRGLLGYSFGGLFSAYVLFTKPNLFKKYLLGAPTLLWDNFYVLKEDQTLLQEINNSQIKVFSAIGSHDFADLLTSWTVLRDKLNSEKFASLNFDYMVFDNEDHVSVIPAIYSRALRNLYSE